MISFVLFCHTKVGSPPQSGPPDQFLQKWSPGPILAAKIGPLLPKTVPPLMYALMHSRTESGKHDLLSGQKQSLM